MKKRPILFSAPMVRAILDGCKTQTRRIWKMPSWAEWDLQEGGEKSGNLIPKDPKNGAWYSVDEVACPYGQIGDRLWVREKFRITGEGPGEKLSLFDRDDVQYFADADESYIGPYHPSIHMPRRFSRIQLEITGIRVERLQDIGQGDACAEGCPIGFEPIDWYRDLWESINGPGSWAANPWVWCVEFRRIRP